MSDQAGVVNNQGSDKSAPLRVFVSVGTDVHPFDRLIDWVEQLEAELTTERIALRVQHGSTRPPVIGSSWPMLQRAAMIREFQQADVVIVSCGPGAVMDARSTTKLPIVVARDAARGEHVDGHQLAFGRHLQSTGMALNATTYEELVALVRRAQASPESFTVAPSRDTPMGIANFGVQVTELLTNTAPRSQR